MAKSCKHIKHMDNVFDRATDLAMQDLDPEDPNYPDSWSKVRVGLVKIHTEYSRTELDSEGCPTYISEDEDLASR